MVNRLKICRVDFKTGKSPQMSQDPSQISVATDSGSSTFQRFCYQAYTAFPFCVECGLSGSVELVIAEHVEDIVVLQEGTWRFIQIKTRNPELGPWRLADLVAENGGLRSLLRTHRLVQNIPATLELFLEGPLLRTDPAWSFVEKPDELDDHLCERVAIALDLKEQEPGEFLRRVKVRHNCSSRQTIVAVNLRRLGVLNRSLNMSELESIHDAIVGEIYKAMNLERLGERWPQYVVDPQTRTQAMEPVYQAKCLTQRKLSPLVARLNTPSKPLLQRLSAPDQQVPSDLELKLLNGGATRQIIDDAKSLRANASMREYEYMSVSLYGDDSILNDVRERLRIYVNSLIALHIQNPKPAVGIWKDLLDKLLERAVDFDRHSMFWQDPYLLLGEVCQMSDECLTDWGSLIA